MPRIQDIPKYTLDGNYRVDVPFSSIERTISEFEEEYKLQTYPDFQRGHVWDRQKRIAFVEHLLQGGKGSDEIRFNCPGWNGDFRGPMVLVDGLQRLTAVRLFLSNIIPAFGYLLREYSDFKIAMRGLNYSLSFRVHDLSTRKEVLQWYLEINAGGVVHTEKELARVRELLEREEQ